MRRETKLTCFLHGLLVLTAASCGSVQGADPDAGVDGPPSDSGGPVDAPLGPWGAVTCDRVTEYTHGVTMRGDGLERYWVYGDDNGANTLFVQTRTSVND